jgi:hemolysin activation/secretion protein
MLRKSDVLWLLHLRRQHPQHLTLLCDAIVTERRLCHVFRQTTLRSARNIMGIRRQHSVRHARTGEILFRRLTCALAIMLLWSAWERSLAAAEVAAAFPPATGGANANTPPTEVKALYIREFRVQGAKLMSGADVGEVVYPYLGPERTAEDVERARAALENAYHSKGFQTVSVEVPQQRAKGGVVVLKVVENKVGRLRVRGARYFLPSDIKREIPSLAEGRVPNFNDVTREIIALNQLADRRVTPVLQAGVEPGTVDIDLNVKDSFPMHGSIELNNRYSADTVPLRLNGSISYNNLWQLAHSAGFSFQVAPERPEDATVFSGYYIAPVPGINGLSLMLMGTSQDSNVSTLGGAAVAGRGQVIGLRALTRLPSRPGFYQSFSFGMDYKHFDEDVTVGTTVLATPIDYYPITANYGATWTDKYGFTEFNGALNFHLRGTGSDAIEFDSKRYLADGAYIYFRGDLSRTHDLPLGLQLFGKIQGQLADSPLINSEQISGGGMSTVRGYLESSALGDNGIFGSLELRSPSLIGSANPDGERRNEWRFYAFYDVGKLTLNEPLPEQQAGFELASWGLGSRLRLFGHLHGSVDFALPLEPQANTDVDEWLLTFRVWADF